MLYIFPLILLWAASGWAACVYTAPKNANRTTLFLMAFMAGLIAGPMMWLSVLGEE